MVGEIGLEAHDEFLARVVSLGPIVSIDDPTQGFAEAKRFQIPAGVSLPAR